MKIRVLSTKTAWAIAFYYIGIIALFGLLIVILVKLIFMPPCSMIAKNECIVDGWSVAGLAGTVLAVAATLLAVLGAVAVAYWWLNLNEKVDARVDEQVKKRIDRVLEEQEEKFTDQTTRLLQEREKKFEEALSKIQKDIDVLNRLTSNINTSLQSAKKDIILVAMLHKPWDLEEWASVFIAVNPPSEVAAHMVHAYLKIVDKFELLNINDTTPVTEYIEQLEKISAPSIDPVYYWNKALSWQKQISSQQQPIIAETANHEIEKRHRIIVLWKEAMEQEFGA